MNFRMVATLFAGVLIAIPAWGTPLSVDVHTADIRSGPSADGSFVILEVPRNYPLQGLEEKNEFFRIRDYRGRIGWVARNLVDSDPSAVVAAGSVNVRKGPGLNHPVIFRAERGVAFQVLEKQPKWLKVRHESGDTGWIYRSLTWMP